MSAPAAATAVAREVAIVISIRSMIMNNHAARAFPISLEKHLSLVTGGDPARTRVRRTRPISVVPRVMAIHRIPVALDPDVLRLWRGRRSHVHHARWRWRTNLNSDRHGRLSPDDRSVHQQTRGNKRCPSQSFHAVTSAPSSATSDPTGPGVYRAPPRRCAVTRGRSTRVPMSSRSITDFKCECRNRKV